jgi:hypothetical protein
VVLKGAIADLAQRFICLCTEKRGRWGAKRRFNVTHSAPIHHHHARKTSLRVHFHVKMLAEGCFAPRPIRWIEGC